MPIFGRLRWRVLLSSGRVGETLWCAGVVMGKGGARSRSGPPPDPDALRRDRDASGWVELPAAGREGPAPAWPLSSPSGRELELWESHWSKPQAILWEQSGLEFEVALYVRNLAMAEVPGSPANRSTLVKQLMEDLGLTEAGLRVNRCRIVDDSKPAKVARPKSRSSARDKLKVVPDERSA